MLFIGGEAIGFGSIRWDTCQALVDVQLAEAIAALVLVGQLQRRACESHIRQSHTRMKSLVSELKCE